MVITCSRFLGCYALLTGILTLLTGCPGAGDRIRFDETANVYTVGNDVCFSVSSAKGYRLYDIAINARRTPTKDKKYILNPALIITDGRFCIPLLFIALRTTGNSSLNTFWSTARIMMQGKPERLLLPSA